MLCITEVLFGAVCLFVVLKLVFHGKQFLAKQQSGIAQNIGRLAGHMCVLEP